MKLTLGFSPCPNDTFIFDALVNKKIDTGDLSFEVVLEDVQTLNKWAMDGILDLSKISYGVLPLVVKEYIVLNAGGALGKGVGPLLITKHETTDQGNINEKTIAIPGENTTAHLLFSLAYPQAKKKKFMIFSGIEDAVIHGKVDLGVIIHENRFTYMLKGLKKVIDLGEYWEQQTQNPIPLGGIVIKRSIDYPIQKRIDLLIRQSVEYAFNNYPTLTDYVKQHSQEMEDHVMRQHIDLYVNNYSIDLGDNGKKAVKKLLSVFTQINPGSEVANGALFIE
ncbi:MAG: 1,4-dihydroxy-6-naphthoate synthase [Bacteroidota bacterium]